MKLFILTVLCFFSFQAFADYKCNVELYRQNDLNLSIGKYVIFGFNNGYHSPTEVTLFVESDTTEKMSSIMFYHTMDTEDGENNLSLSLVRQNVLWGVNADYNHTKYQNLGRVITNGDEQKTYDFENYHLSVQCLIKN